MSCPILTVDSSWLFVKQCSIAKQKTKYLRFQIAFEELVVLRPGFGTRVRDSRGQENNILERHSERFYCLF